MRLIMNLHGKHRRPPDPVEPERTALILIDVINDMDSPDLSRGFLDAAGIAARQIRELKRRAKAAGIPTIYANDNFGNWRAEFSDVIAHCTRPGVPGKPISELLLPQGDDYFVLKPRHSGFFGTALELLLQHMKKDTLILAGFAGDICVLFTAHDAYMREYDLFVPRDCVASSEPAANEQALRFMSDVAKADTRASNAFEFPETPNPRAAPPQQFEVLNEREAQAAAPDAASLCGEEDPGAALEYLKDRS